MLDQTITTTLIDRLVPLYDPLAIYIFGSYAWGKPHEDSDIDILVVVKNAAEKPHYRAIPGLSLLSDLPIPKDLLIYTEEEFNARCNDKGMLPYLVKRHGKCIYTQS